MEHIQEQTKVFFERRITTNKEDRDEFSLVYEGEVPMSQQEADQLKLLLGDGNASVTMGREVGEMSYGNGGKCYARVTIRCDLSQDAVRAAQGWASYLAESIITEEHAKMKAQIALLGINTPSRQ